MLSVASERATPLLGLWVETRLRAAMAGEAPLRRSRALGEPRFWAAAATWLLDEACGYSRALTWCQGAWRQAGRRNSPSAGNLYPYEAVVVLPGLGAYLFDPERRSLGALAKMGDFSAKETGLPVPQGRRVEAWILFLSRPWLSLRKYGLRGYAYAHLDIGHAATNLWLAAAAMGQEPAVHLDFDRRAVGRSLGLRGHCLEPTVALSFVGDGQAKSPWPGSEPRGPDRVSAGHWPRPSAGEMESWRRLRPCLAPPAQPGSVKPAAGSSEAATLQPFLAPVEAHSSLRPRRLPKAPGETSFRRSLAASMAGRRSAKGFLPEGIGWEQLGPWLGALLPLGPRVDALGGGKLGLRLICRRVDGMQGIYLICPHRRSLLGPLNSSPFPDFGPACMHQEVAEEAALLLLFHAPVRRLLAAEGWAAMAGLHFMAASLAQRLYLSATGLGLGMTVIGGFDEEACARLGDLAPEEETLYVVAAGVADGRASKSDRLDVAHSHGFRGDAFAGEEAGIDDPARA